MSATPMPRPQSENVFQVAFKIPKQWVAMADEIAAAMSQPGIANTRTDALRAALWHGLNALHAQHVQGSVPPAPPSKPRAKTKR